jgi:hypothetical protein
MKNKVAEVLYPLQDNPQWNFICKMFITPEVNIAGNSVRMSRVLTIVTQIVPSTNLPTP